MAGIEMAVCKWRCTQVGRRGAPAKGVGRVTGAGVQISPSPPGKAHICPSRQCVLFYFNAVRQLSAKQATTRYVADGCDITPPHTGDLSGATKNGLFAVDFGNVIDKAQHV